jgi:hypothetical protein
MISSASLIALNAEIFSRKACSLASACAFS